MRTHQFISFDIIHNKQGLEHPSIKKPTTVLVMQYNTGSWQRQTYYQDLLKHLAGWN